MDFFETSAFTNHNITEVRLHGETLLSKPCTEMHVPVIASQGEMSWCLIMSMCLLQRLLHDWLSRCWQPTKKTWIYSGCPLTTSSISLLWRKRRDSVTVLLATNAKAAGVRGKPWILTEHMSHMPHTLHTPGKMFPFSFFFSHLRMRLTCL